MNNVLKNIRRLYIEPPRKPRIINKNRYMRYLQGPSKRNSQVPFKRNSQEYNRALRALKIVVNHMKLHGTFTKRRRNNNNNNNTNKKRSRQGEFYMRRSMVFNPGRS